MMSGLNLLPTAVVSPMIAESEEKEIKNFDSVSSLSSNRHKCEERSTQNNLVENSEKLFLSDSQNLLKNVSVTACDKSQYSALSNCTVELTNYKHKSGQLDIGTTVGQHRELNSDKSIAQRNNVNTFAKSSFLTDSDDEISLQSLKLHNSKKNNTSCRRRKQPISKQNNDSSVEKRVKRNLTKVKNSPVAKINSSVHKLEKQQSSDSLAYIPQLSDISRKFPSNMIVCSLCHLPANFFPQLGDLFGPYRPSSNEIVDKYKGFHEKFSAQNMNACSSLTTKAQQKICVDQGNRACYIDTASFENANNIEKTLKDLSPQSISGSEKMVESFMPQLKLLQTADCLLSESNKKAAARFCRNSKSLRVSGFAGKITSTDKTLPVYADANKTLLHDINTLVFVEPTKTIPTSAQSSSDSTTIDVVHKFDISPVWIHGPCAVWSPGIYCIRNQIFGLTPTIQQAADSICSYCNRPGATIPCRFEKATAYHYLCCIAKGLTLDESSFMAVR